MKNYFLFLLLILQTIGTQAQTNSSYTLHFGETIRPQTVNTNYPLRLHRYFLFDGTRRVNFTDIAYFEKGTNRFAILGVSKSGKLETAQRLTDYPRIDIYAATDERLEPYPIKDSYKTITKYILKDQESLLPYKYKYIREAVLDQKESLAFMNKARQWRTVDQISLGVGLGLALYYVQESLRNFSEPSQDFLFVPIIFFVPLGTKPIKEGYYEDAIRQYK
ncbi:MAG: hypothetical protein AAGI23_02625 [Bacteroidota bacterium]